jgi:hypothetical protein
MELLGGTPPPVIRRIREDSSPTEENLDWLAAFVRQFSLGGIGRIRANRSLLATRQPDRHDIFPKYLKEKS